MILVFSGISQNCFCIEKSHGSGLWITGPRSALSPWWAHRERGSRRGFYQWRHLEVKLRRWSHDGTQQRRLVVLRWRDDSGCEEERLEPGGCGG
jgi:hypothetical protein